MAEDKRLGGRYVAIKVLSSQHIPATNYQIAVEMFRQEAMMLSRLDHPGIAKVSDWFSEGGQEYLVMEYVVGQMLDEMLQQVPTGRYIANGQVFEWLNQLAQLLHYLHSQSPPVIFRDLKPANIIVQPDNSLKLIDFGIARFFRPGQTHDTHYLGTPGYASPEQHGYGQSDVRSDIYSLGVLIHQLLTGHDPTQTPFNLPPVRETRPELPPHLEKAIQQATELNPNNRFQTILQFQEAMFPIAHNHPPIIHDRYTIIHGRYTWIGVGLVIGLILFLGVSMLALRPQLETY